MLIWLHVVDPPPTKILQMHFVEARHNAEKHSLLTFIISLLGVTQSIYYLDKNVVKNNQFTPNCSPDACLPPPDILCELQIWLPQVTKACHLRHVDFYKKLLQWKRPVSKIDRAIWMFLICQELEILMILCFPLKEVEARLESIERQQGLMREENANLKHDTNVLINVISSARTHGRWDVCISLFPASWFSP